MLRESSVFFILCGWLIIALHAGNVEFKKCPKGKTGADDSVIKAIRVSDCTKQPCTLKRGEAYKFEIDFVPNQSATEVDVAAFGVLMGTVEMAWPGVLTNVCKNETFNIKCPVDEGKPQTYINNVKILPNYPATKVSVRWKVKLDGKLASCSVVEVKIA